MNEIIPYHEMCRRENSSLQQGMNFNLGRNYSVILMSVRPNAPYQDQVAADAATGDNTIAMTANTLAALYPFVVFIFLFSCLR